MVLPSVAEKKFTEGHKKMKICVTGAGGFIASHLSKRLKEEGHFIRAARLSKQSPAWPGCQRGPSGCLAEAGRSSGSTAFSRQRPPESRHAGRGLKPPLFPVTGAVDWKENEYSRVMESATALSVTPPPRPPGSLYTLGESAPAAQGLPWCCRPPVPTTLILRLSTPRYMPTDSFCDEFVNLDLRWPENCKKAVEGCDWCFNLAVRPPPSQLHRTHPRLPRRSSPFGGHL